MGALFLEEQIGDAAKSNKEQFYSFHFHIPFYLTSHPRPCIHQHSARPIDHTP